MTRNMKADRRIWIVAAVVVVGALTAYWSLTSEHLATSPEHLWWGRWNLSEEQRREIDQLIRDMRRNGATPKEIGDALSAKLDEWNIRPPPPGDIEVFYTIKAVISSINLTLLVFLLVTYVDIYKKTKSEFTIGLMIFAMVLLLYALSSNPLVHQIFGFRALGLGPFAMLPDLFTLAALVTLLYLTYR